MPANVKTDELWHEDQRRIQRAVLTEPDPKLN